MSSALSQRLATSTHQNHYSNNVFPKKPIRWVASHAPGNVGVDTGAPVSPDYGSQGNEFTGRVKGVQLAIAQDAVSVDHLVSPEEAVRIAMARQ